MLNDIVDYAIPVCIFVLMLLAGTEAFVSDFRRIAQDPVAALTGAIGPAFLLPVASLGLAAAFAPNPTIAAALLILSLCPGGAISNCYCYLAGLSVPLSACITTAGTVLSFVTIPLWFWLLAALDMAPEAIPAMPIPAIMAQLAALMILPMSIGMAVTHLFPRVVERHSRRLRFASLAIVLVVLIAIATTVRQFIAMQIGGIALTAVLFVVCAMLTGRLVAWRIAPADRPVVVIECAARNIPVAMIIGRSVLGDESFGVFAGFLTAYFIAEILIVLSYATLMRRRSKN